MAEITVQQFRSAIKQFNDVKASIQAAKKAGQIPVVFNLVDNGFTPEERATLSMLAGITGPAGTFAAGVAAGVALAQYAGVTAEQVAGYVDAPVAPDGQAEAVPSPVNNYIN